MVIKLNLENYLSHCVSFTFYFQHEIFTLRGMCLVTANLFLVPFKTHTYVKKLCSAMISFLSLSLSFLEKRKTTKHSCSITSILRNLLLLLFLLLEFINISNCWNNNRNIVRNEIKIQRKYLLILKLNTPFSCCTKFLTKNSSKKNDL